MFSWCFKPPKQRSHKCVEDAAGSRPRDRPPLQHLEQEQGGGGVAAFIAHGASPRPSFQHNASSHADAAGLPDLPAALHLIETLQRRVRALESAHLLGTVQYNVQLATSLQAAGETGCSDGAAGSQLVAGAAKEAVPFQTYTNKQLVEHLERLQKPCAAVLLQAVAEDDVSLYPAALLLDVNCSTGGPADVAQLARLNTATTVASSAGLSGYVDVEHSGPSHAEHSSPTMLQRYAASPFTRIRAYMLGAGAARPVVACCNPAARSLFNASRSMQKEVEGQVAHDVMLGMLLQELLDGLLGAGVPGAAAPEPDELTFHHFVHTSNPSVFPFVPMELRACAYVKSTGVIVPAVLIEYSPDSQQEAFLHHLRRDYTMMSHMASIVTLFDMQGRVLHQNAGSVAYYGYRRRVHGTLDDHKCATSRHNHSRPLSPGPGGPGAAGGPANDASQPSVLQELFCMASPDAVSDLLESVVQGTPWKSIVPMPASLVPTRPATDPSLKVQHDVISLAGRMPAAANDCTAFTHENNALVMTGASNVVHSEVGAPLLGTPSSRVETLSVPCTRPGSPCDSGELLRAVSRLASSREPSELYGSSPARRTSRMLEGSFKLPKGELLIQPSSRGNSFTSAAAHDAGEGEVNQPPNFQRRSSPRSSYVAPTLSQQVLSSTSRLRGPVRLSRSTLDLCGSATATGTASPSIHSKGPLGGSNFTAAGKKRGSISRRASAIFAGSTSSSPMCHSTLGLLSAHQLHAALCSEQPGPSSSGGKTPLSSYPPSTCSGPSALLRAAPIVGPTVSTTNGTTYLRRACSAALSAEPGGPSGAHYSGGEEEGDGAASSATAPGTAPLQGPVRHGLENVANGNGNGGHGSAGAVVPGTSFCEQSNVLAAYMDAAGSSAWPPSGHGPAPVVQRRVPRRTSSYIMCGPASEASLIGFLRSSATFGVRPSAQGMADMGSSHGSEQHQDGSVGYCGTLGPMQSRGAPLAGLRSTALPPAVPAAEGAPVSPATGTWNGTSGGDSGGTGATGDLRPSFSFNAATNRRPAPLLPVVDEAKPPPRGPAEANAAARGEDKEPPASASASGGPTSIRDSVAQPSSATDMMVSPGNSYGLLSDDAIGHLVRQLNASTAGTATGDACTSPFETPAAGGAMAAASSAGRAASNSSAVSGQPSMTHASGASSMARMLMGGTYEMMGGGGGGSHASGALAGSSGGNAVVGQQPNSSAAPQDMPPTLRGGRQAPRRSRTLQLVLRTVSTRPLASDPAPSAAVLNGGGGGSGCSHDAGGSRGGSGNHNRSSRPGSAVQQQLVPAGGQRVHSKTQQQYMPQQPPGSWHEVTATSFTDPVSKVQAIMVVQVDVTARVQLEKRLTEVVEAEHALLENVFPRHVIEHIALTASGSGSQPFNLQMLSGLPDLTATATDHPQVTIMFADIVGFTAMCKEVSAKVVMGFLNQLYSRFDSLLDVYGVYKVETIGDCYLVAGGLIMRDADGASTVRQGPNDKLQAWKVLSFAKAMLREARQVVLPNTGEPVKMRVGIHTGPVVSGIVGRRMPRFCLFGDTINTASRMESTCPFGSIQVSATTHELVTGEDWEATGGVQVKGKGVMQTYIWRPPVDLGEVFMTSSASIDAAHSTRSAKALMRPGLAVASLTSSGGRKRTTTPLRPLVGSGDGDHSAHGSVIITDDGSGVAASLAEDKAAAEEGEAAAGGAALAGGEGGGAAASAAEPGKAAAGPGLSASRRKSKRRSSMAMLMSTFS